LVYWRAARSAHPTRAELDNLLLDAALLGAWVAYLGFAVWITYALLAAAMLNAAVNRGWQGTALALASSAIGAGLWVAVGGLRVTPETSPWVTYLAVAGSAAYTSAIGFVVWTQTRRLGTARHDLARSEERYRLIAENADDLVAMVDHEGRWLYTSPSYRRVLEAAELEPGGDGAFSEITGHARDEVLGQPEKAIRSGLLPQDFYDDAYAAVLRDGYWSGTTWSRRKNGSVYREWRSLRSVKDPAGAVTHYVHVFYEVGTARGSASSSG